MDSTDQPTPTPTSTPTSVEAPPAETTQRTLLITIGEGGQSGTLNPFQLHRAISRFGEATRSTRQTDGKVEVVMKTSEGAQKLANAKTLTIQTKNDTRTIPITVNFHPTKGFLMGVITVPDMSDVTDDDMLEELRDQGVQRVRRIMRREDGNTVPTDTFVLSFLQESLPDRVQVTFRSPRVRPYIPNPVRCFKCQTYGHVANSCNRKERCARCSTVGHKSSACRAVKPKCTCGGDHPVWDRSCPKLREEVKKAKDRASANQKPQPSPRPPPNVAECQEPTTTPSTQTSSYPPLPTTERQTPTATSTSFRSAPARERRAGQETSGSGLRAPIITLDTKVQDCLQFSLQQLMDLLISSSVPSQRCQQTTSTNDLDQRRRNPMRPPRCDTQGGASRPPGEPTCAPMRGRHRNQ